MGYLGFAEDCETTIEGSIIYVWNKWLATGYEYRQKNNPYKNFPGILEGEEDWHSLFAGFMITDRLTVAVGWAWLGDVGNTNDTCGVAAQVKYEF